MLKSVRAIAEAVRGYRDADGTSGPSRELRLGADSTWKERLTPDVDAPVLIVGSPRSGTTFLGECLRAVPEMTYFFEPTALNQVIGDYLKDRREVAQSASRLRARLRWLVRARFDGDRRPAVKDPAFSFVPDLLAEAFPDASYLHILRDGRDVAASLRSKGMLPTGVRPAWLTVDTYGAWEGLDEVERCVRCWRVAVEHAATMERQAPDRYLEIVYEDLVSDPQGTAEAMAEFLDLEDERSRAVLRRRIREVHGDSVGRWRSDFSEEEIERIEAVAGPALRRYGYA